MRTIYDIAINLGCSFVFFVLGVIVHAAMEKWKQNKNIIIWKFIANNNELSIAMSLRDGPHPTSTSRASIAEVLALADILPTFQKMPVHYNIINNNDDYKLSMSSNLLCIGGPKANSVTLKVWDLYANLLPVSIEYDPFCIKIGKKKYETQYSDNGNEIIIDYGIVLVICEKSDTGTLYSRVLAFGGRGLGTRGVVRSLSNPDLIKRFKWYSKNNSFLAIIGVSGKENDLHTSVKEFYALDMYR